MRETDPAVLFVVFVALIGMMIGLLYLMSKDVEL
jgi:hypothetical protein